MHEDCGSEMDVRETYRMLVAVLRERMRYRAKAAGEERFVEVDIATVQDIILHLERLI